MGEFTIIEVPKPEKTRVEKGREALAQLARIRRAHPDVEVALSFNGELVDESELAEEVKRAFPDFDPVGDSPVKPSQG